jgi:hypothetical protein
MALYAIGEHIAFVIGMFQDVIQDVIIGYTVCINPYHVTFYENIVSN